MATIKLTIDSNFDKAEKELKDFGNLTESEAKRLKRFQDRYKSTAVDSFIQKQNRASAAITATRGPMEALAVKHRGLQREIERLIRSGIDPQDAAVAKLRKEYTKTSAAIEKNSNKSKKAAARARALKTAVLATAAAAGAAAIAFAKNAFSVAKAGDEYAKTGRVVGLTAEELQELRFVAERSGVGPAKFTESLKKMNKAVGDTRVGSGALTTLLKTQNPELLNQIKTVKSSKEAFALLNGAIADTENAQDKAALAQAAFGKTGQDMINIASLSAKELANMKTEAQAYGLISNEAAVDSEQFMDAQTNLKAALRGVRNEVGTSMIPAFTKLMTFGTKFTVFFRSEIEVMAFQFTVFTSKMQLGFLSATSAMKVAMANFASFIGEKLIRSIQTFLFVAEEIPFVGKKFAGVAADMDKMRQQLHENASGVKNDTDKQIAWTKMRADAVKKEAELNIEAIQEVQAARLAAIDAGVSAAPVVPAGTGSGDGRIGGGAAVEKPEDLKARLTVLNNVHRQAQIENVDSFGAFLKARMDQEQVTGEERIVFLQQELARIKELNTIDGEEKIAAALAVKEQLDIVREQELEAEKKAAVAANKIQKDQQKARFASAQSMVNGVGSLFNTIDGIMANSGKKSRALAIAQKAVAVAQIGIQTALGVARALGSAAPPLNFINAGLVTAAGVGAGIKAATTPIPSAETGGRFTVPDVGTGVDNVGLKVNGGETIDVAPRGENPGRDVTVIVKLEDQTVWDSMQRGFDGNEVTLSNDNVRAAS